MFDFDLDYDKRENNKKTVNEINVRKLITEDYNPYDLHISKVKPKIQFDGNSKRSTDIPDLKFSNKLPSIEQRAVDSYIKIAINSLKNNPEILKESYGHVDYSGKYMNRIKTILSQYITEDKFDEICDYFIKSDIKTGILLKDRGAFRVISFYQVEPKKDKRQRRSKHYLNVVMLDPYHLFIPSRHNGKSSEEYLEEVYNEICEFPDHIEKLI